MVLEWILAFLKATLQQGEPITIVNFGGFSVRKKHARRERNPSTGDAMLIPARRVVTFRASPQLKAEMNTGQAEAVT